MRKIFFTYLDRAQKVGYPFHSSLRKSHTVRHLFRQLIDARKSKLLNFYPDAFLKNSFSYRVATFSVQENFAPGLRPKSVLILKFKLVPKLMSHLIRATV